MVAGFFMKASHVHTSETQLELPSSRVTQFIQTDSNKYDTQVDLLALSFIFLKKIKLRHRVKMFTHYTCSRIFVLVPFNSLRQTRIIYSAISLVQKPREPSLLYTMSLLDGEYPHLSVPLLSVNCYDFLGNILGWLPHFLLQEFSIPNYLC